MGESGHELVRRVKGNFGNARTAFARLHGVEAALGRKRQQRALCRVADQLAVTNAGIRAQRGGRKQRRPLRRRAALRRDNLAADLAEGLILGRIAYFDERIDLICKNLSRE